MLLSLPNAVARFSDCSNMSLIASNSKCAASNDESLSTIPFRCTSCAAKIDLSSSSCVKSLALHIVSSASCCFNSPQSLSKLPIPSSAFAFAFRSEVPRSNTSSLDSIIIRCEEALATSALSILSCRETSFSSNTSHRTDSTRILLLKSASSATSEWISASLSKRIFDRAAPSTERISLNCIYIKVTIYQCRIGHESKGHPVTV